MSKTLIQLQQEHHKLLNEFKTLSEKETLEDLEQRRFDDLETQLKASKETIEKRTLFNKYEIAQAKEKPFEKENRKFSLVKAISFLTGKGPVNVDVGYEREVHQELAKTIRPQDDGVLIPLTAFETRRKTHPKLEKRVVTGQSALIQEDVDASEAIEGLYEKSMFDQLGVRRLQADGNFTIPKASSVSSDWFTGDGGVADQDAITESDPTFSSITFNPKFLAVMSGFTIRQITESNPNIGVEMLIRDELRSSMVSTLFTEFINTSAAANKKPIASLLSLIPSRNNTAVTVKVDLSTKWMLADLESSITKVYKAMLNQTVMPKWLFSHTDRGLLRQTLITATDTASNFLWDMDAVCDVPALATNALETNAILGDWSEVFLCNFGAMELTEGYIGDDFKRSITRLRAIMPVDVQVRRTEAFQKFTITRS